MRKTSFRAPCANSSESTVRDSSYNGIRGESNYTGDIKAAFRQAAPRRRTRLASNLDNSVSGESWGVAVDQFYPQEEESAIRSRRAASFQRSHNLDRASGWPIQHLDQESAQESHHERLLNGRDVSRICKKPRRSTLSIRPDDTDLLTIPSSLQLELQKEEASGQALIVKKNTNYDEKPGNRRKSLAAAPKRTPLLPMLKPLQEVDDRIESNRAAAGKENIPPGISLGSKTPGYRKISSRARRFSIFDAAPEQPFRSARLFDYETPQAGQITESTQDDQRSCLLKSIPDRNSQSNRRASMMNRRNTIYYGADWKIPAPRHGKVASQRPHLPVAVIPKAAKTETCYQVLEEDIHRPEMFEETWLSCQESAVQQLLNQLFDKASEKAEIDHPSPCELRSRLLQLYQDCENAMIFRRVHASLLYGALKSPKDSFADTYRLQTDVGLRKNFLALWIGCYNLDALITVAEVVIGRKMSPDIAPSSKLPRKQENSSKERTREAEAFLESCLLRNEDAREVAGLPTANWCWRRTMLRCLMMVLLLDRAKESGLLRCSLFQPLARNKSSREVLVNLCSLISPFLGDTIRPLAHLHYHVHHIQNPLSEYEYGVRNLATDLRDGVQLTHLVELLLCQPRSLSGNSVNFDGGTLCDTRFSLPLHTQNPCPLSQRLRFPCESFSQRVGNVQLALNTLGEACGIHNTFLGIEAEDIVNGHREKTLTLLWGLVGKIGLDLVIDFDEVHSETARISKKSTFKEKSGFTRENYPGTSKLVDQINLLKQWAQSIAQQQGLQVSNLTTSFSNGKVFAAIVEEYRRYLPQCASLTRQNKIEGQLATRLKEIGCTDTFANIFACNEQGRVFDREFTIAALAFLCSRLLSASRRGIAASVIYSAYSRYKYRQTLRQRSSLLMLAHECRAVYFTRKKVINAARILQRSWRIYQCRKKQRERLGEHPTMLSGNRETVHGQINKDSDRQIDIWLL